MLRLEIEKAAHGLSQSASGVGEQSSIQIQGNGLGSNHTGGRFEQADLHPAASRYECADGSARRPLSANMPVPLRSKRCELGGLLHSLRRMTAAPALIRAVAFSFGGVCAHGLFAPALYRFCGLMPCGEPLRSPFPKTRSANPHGVALLLAERGDFRKSVLGACHE